VSVVVNNAGIARAVSVLDADASTLRSELETNPFGTLAVASAFADRLAQRSGIVINMASVASWLPNGGSYGVSKAAVWSATESMRLELGPRGVQVVGVHVGFVDTDMRRSVLLRVGQSGSWCRHPARRAGRISVASATDDHRPARGEDHPLRSGADLSTWSGRSFRWT
jgi:NAD(P)-dependent dehydrogenase (short-subunit alcohol dehydrogenase family)